MQKTDLGTIPHSKSSESGERIPTFSDVLPLPHLKGACRLERAPPTL
jgi:hypothetical protein